jgi:hypothetical protein
MAEWPTLGTLGEKIPADVIAVPAPRMTSSDLVHVPRNPARAPQGVEDAIYGMTVKPLFDIGMGIGSVVEGQGWNSPEASAGFLAAMGLLTPMRALRPGIKAYHGSPHDFDRFDINKIGTGEGAQAYGHGLYFAENPKVAENYRPEGTTKQVFANGRLERAWDTPRGKMYEVSINAKPEQFLDWDAKVRDMPPGVQANLSKLGLNIQGSDQGLVGSQIVNRGIDAGGASAASRAMNDAGIPGIRYLDQGSRRMSDAQIHQEIAASRADLDYLRKMGETDRIPEFEQRIATLQDKLKNPQTSNYVLFRDDIIDILRKYGIMAPASGVALDQATQRQ